MGLKCICALNRVFKCRSDMQNIKLEQNTEIKGCRSNFTKSGKCNEVLKRTEQSRKAYSGVNTFW